MNLYVVDTHALHWYLMGEKQLSRKVKTLLDSLSSETAHVYVPTVVLAEILALEEKGRTAATFDFVLEQLQANPNYTIISLTLEIVEAAKQVSGAAELFDRLIAATAICLEAKLITHDAVLSSLKNIQTVW